MAVALGGLDTVAFTGGVGEGSSDVRDRVCELLEFLGNFDVVVAPAREELVIARAVQFSPGRLEAETDVGARLPLGYPSGDVSHADHPDRPLVHDDGEVMKAVGVHQPKRRIERRVRRGGDRLGRHPLPSSRLARVDASGERTDEIP